MERVFSQVNIIKSNKRTLLSGDALGDLLLLSTIKYHIYLKQINTHLTLGEGQNGKLYGSGPDPFPPPRNKRERVCNARLLKTGMAEDQD